MATKTSARKKTGLGKREPSPKSPYKGVSWHRRSKRWQVVFRYRGEVHYAGQYPPTSEGEIQAARAYDEAIRILNPDAEVNFPDPSPLPESPAEPTPEAPTPASLTLEAPLEEPVQKSLIELLESLPAAIGTTPNPNDDLRLKIRLALHADFESAARRIAFGLASMGSIARPAEILESNLSRGLNDSQLRIESASEGGAHVWAARLQQPLTSGAFRSTEATLLRIRHNAAPTLSLRVHTYNGEPEAHESHRARVLKLAQQVIREFATHYVAAHPIADLEEVTEVARQLHDPSRPPFVLVSPRSHTHHYLVDPDMLAQALGGVATVFRLDPILNSYKVGDILGEQYNAFNGSVSLLSIPRDGLIDVRRFLSREIEALGGTRTVLQTIFEEVATRNFPALPDLIRPEAVRGIALQVDPGAVKPLALPEVDEITVPDEPEEQPPPPQRSEESESSEELKIRSLEQKVEDQEKARRLLAEALLDNRAEQLSLDNAHALRLQLLKAALPDPTPAEILVAVQAIFPNRIFVLPTGWDSANASAPFHRGSRLLEMMLTLAGPFWEEVASGRPESEARRHLGQAYAARESESVANNNRARSLRTFSYHGEEILMERHLRIGTKPSVHETIRVHFHWDADRKLLVIGHCGEHLDHR